MKYLVTGGAGFIGSNIVKHLIYKDKQVRIIDNLSSGKKENIRAYLTKIEFIQGDIRDEHILKEAMEDIDVVFHLAAMVSVPASVANPELCHAINANGSFNVLKAAKEAGVRRVVLSSSSAVYGENEISPKIEELPFDLRSPYAAAKAQMELSAQMFTHVYGLETVCLRYFNVFGPNQDPNSQYAAVIPKFIKDISTGSVPKIYGDGEQTRDFVYVSDVVEANILAAKIPAIAGQVFNIASGTTTSINQLYEAINKILGSKIPPDYLQVRPGDIKHSSASIEKARKLLKYNPKVSLEEGLGLIVNRLSKNEAAVAAER